MSNEPTILYGLPIVAVPVGTDVSRFVDTWKATPGAIWILPEGAVLIMPPPQEVNQDAEA